MLEGLDPKTQVSLVKLTEGLQSVPTSSKSYSGKYANHIGDICRTVWLVVESWTTRKKSERNERYMTDIMTSHASRHPV